MRSDLWVLVISSTDKFIFNGSIDEPVKIHVVLKESTHALPLTDTNLTVKNSIKGYASLFERSKTTHNNYMQHNKHYIIMQLFKIKTSLIETLRYQNFKFESSLRC